MSSVVLCKVCNNQRFKNPAAYEQHVRDSASHRARVRQQVVCLVCPGAKTFKDAAAYNNHVLQNREHRMRAAQAASGPSASSANPSPFSRSASRTESVASAASAATVQTPPVSRPSSFIAPALPRVMAVGVVNPDIRPSLSRLRRASTASSSVVRESVVDTPPARTPCVICRDLVEAGGRDRHTFEKHPELCCLKCSIILGSPSMLEQHWKESSAHPNCDYCPAAFADAAAHVEHVADVHTRVHTKHQDSLYEVANAHIAATPLQESYSQVSSSDYSYRAPSPLSSCDLSDVPEQPDIAEVSVQEEPCETPKSDVPAFQRGLATGIAPVSEQARAASEPPLSAVSHPTPSTTPDRPVEPTRTFAESTRSIISQAASVFPSTPSAGDVVELPQQSRSAGPSRSSSLDARPPSKTASTWSVISSPRSSARRRSAERHASPGRREPDGMAHAGTPRTETPRRAREAPAVREVPVFRPAPVRPTGSTVASEASSAPPTPVSVRSTLISTLTEQLAARRARLEDAGAHETAQSRGSAHASCRSSDRATPTATPRAPPRDRTPERKATGSTAVESSSAAEQPRPATKSRTTSRTRTSSSYEPALTGETQIDPTAAPDSESAGAFPLPKPRLQWHCRVCLRLPTDPTVTMCGHLFCHECIVVEMAKNLQCPVCRTAMLVRLDVAVPR